MRSSLSLNNSESIEAKQAYVYTNIFESEYDIEEFAQYLAKQPPIYSSNLEDLTYDTIKKAVDTFIEQRKLPGKIELERNEQYEMSDQLKVDQQKYMDVNLKSITCVKEINKFALTSIHVNIISYKKNQGKFLRRDFITFKIQLPQLHKQIDRRYSHFEWLRNILIYFHPGVVVPPLPKKKMKKIFTDEHLKKKGRMLQNFLRKCLQIPDLRNDENMYRFLTVQNSQKLEQYIKQNKLSKKALPMDKIKSSTGKIQYGINDQLITINRKGAQYFQKLSPFMKQLYKQVKRIEQNLGQCTIHLQNLEQLSKKFAPVQAQFRRQCKNKQFHEDEQREKSFLETISGLAENYKKQVGTMKQTWQKQLYMKLKYEFHHSQCMTEFINEYQKQEKTFYELRQQLNRDKLKNYQQPINNWDISEDHRSKYPVQKPTFNEISPYLFPKRSNQLKHKEMQYALHTRQLANSITHYARFNNIYNMKILEKFLEKQYKLDGEWSQKMKEMIAETCDNVDNMSQMIKTKLDQGKSMLVEGKNSIKGFFSQFEHKKQFTVMETKKKSGIRQVSDAYNGF